MQKETTIVRNYVTVKDRINILLKRKTNQTCAYLHATTVTSIQDKSTHESIDLVQQVVDLLTVR